MLTHALHYSSNKIRKTENEHFIIVYLIKFEMSVIVNLKQISDLFGVYIALVGGR